MRNQGIVGTWNGTLTDSVFNRSFDRASRSQRLIAVSGPLNTEDERDHVALIFHWFEELQRLVPAGR